MKKHEHPHHGHKPSEECAPVILPTEPALRSGGDEDDSGNHVPTPPKPPALPGGE